MSNPAKKFPSGATYVEALQNTSLCFRGTKLADAQVRLDKLGRPKAISGNFASVFAVTATTGHRYAVKCFTREVADQQLRYQAISDHLTSLTYDWKVDFEYASEGILVEGNRYPILVMEWVEAENLTLWIDGHLHDRAALVRLADRFVRLTGELATAGIGHGDLQHGNILVTRTGSIRLVDYDGMYVPALDGLPAAEDGHRNYQPPNRSARDFGPAVDRFSEWVVYLSLFTIGIDPDTWRTLRQNGAEQLLLADEDFREPGSSFRLSMLLGHNEPAIRDLALRFRELIGQPLSAMPLVAPAVIPAAPQQTSTMGTRAVPSWITDHIPPDVPAASPVTFVHRPKPLRFAGFLALAMLLAAAISIAVTAVGLALMAFAVLTTAIWLGCALVSYRRQSEYRQASAARAQETEVTKRLAAAGKAVSTLEQQTRKMDRADADRKAEQTKRQQMLQQQYERSKLSAQQAVQQQLAGLDAQLHAKAVEHDRKLQYEIGLIQRSYVHAQLSSKSISSADITGISTALTTKLRENGIATAADFIGIDHWQGKVVFRLANNSQVYVPGIGDTKASRLMTWRNSQQARARSSQPTTLPTAARQALENQYQAGIAGVRAQKQRLSEALVTSQAQLTARLNLDRKDLIDQFSRNNTAAAQARAGHEAQLSRARQTFAAISKEKQTVDSETFAYRQISYRSYLGFLLSRTR